MIGSTHDKIYDNLNDEINNFIEWFNEEFDYLEIIDCEMTDFSYMSGEIDLILDINVTNNMFGIVYDSTEKIELVINIKDSLIACDEFSGRLLDTINKGYFG